MPNTFYYITCVCMLVKKKNKTRNHPFFDPLDCSQDTALTLEVYKENKKLPRESIGQSGKKY